jgi:type VI secretion system protein ImpL
VANLPAAADTIGAQQAAQAGQAGLAQAGQAKVAARQLAQGFAGDTAAAPLGPAVAALLVAPIEGAEGVLREAAMRRPPPARPAVAAGAPAAAPPPPAARADAGALAALNERGRALCAAAAPVLAKFPFNPDARDEAAVAEVNAVFAPASGALWAFYHERLEPYLERQGDRYVPRPGAPPVLSAPFVAFFNRAARTSDALYPGGAAEPRVVLTARSATPRRALLLSQGSQEARLARNAPPVQFAWPSTTGREARLAVSEREFIILGKTRVAARAAGEWALFRLVAQAARWEPAGPGAWRAEWNAGGPAAVEFGFPAGAPVLQRGWLGGAACPAPVTR